ncbi:hypothetical protein JCM19314_166 [Nonlabens ulvanivorans]|uniref:TonB-dependent receptor n=1 Tax=Nonlabens ulvanivorans TaxID=906888 RepID=A0A090QCY3_NONUL|nr:hypothetical protein JCM19314_166 [Nonlabens ulvanivorans]
MAQQATIQGVILDEFNEPVKDVNVSIQGTTIGTASNENGFYQLKSACKSKSGHHIYRNKL